MSEYLNEWKNEWMKIYLFVFEIYFEVKEMLEDKFMSLLKSSLVAIILFVW